MRIVLTGGTSGIGLKAASHLAAAGKLIVGARAPDRRPAALPTQATLLPLDLADLASARQFADGLEGTPIDRLVLNAGLQTMRRTLSAQGLEVTFAANHLAHFYLLQRLVGSLAPQARIIITASGTHDPDLKTGMPPPNHADARRLAYPDSDSGLDADAAVAGRRAYSSSKLCNVMTALELSRRLADRRPDVAVAAFDPAFTPGTGLARDYPALLDFVFRRLMPLVVRGEHVSTPAASGGYLAQTALDPAHADARGRYYSVRWKKLTMAQPSRLAREEAACARLWGDSLDLLAETGFRIENPL